MTQIPSKKQKNPGFMAEGGKVKKGKGYCPPSAKPMRRTPRNR